MPFLVTKPIRKSLVGRTKRRSDAGMKEGKKEGRTEGTDGTEEMDGTEEGTEH
jgi:hypothetical protein